MWILRTSLIWLLETVPSSHCDTKKAFHLLNFSSEGNLLRGPYGGIVEVVYARKTVNLMAIAGRRLGILEMLSLLKLLDLAILV